MDTNKLLSADLLDIIFDNRNKAYGAYELRRSYSKRITKSLVFTGIFISLIFAGVVLGNKLQPTETSKYVIIPDVTLSTVDLDEPKPEPIPEPPRQIEQPQVQTVHLATVEITRDEDVEAPPPTQADLKNAQVGLQNIEGVDFNGTVTPPTLIDEKGIIEDKIVKEPEGPLDIVQVQARYDGNWVKFLERNLNGQVAIEHDAPPGTYTVLLQFVVDIDGSISDIKVLNNPGYGLDQEAIRVIRKSKKWEPAIHDGRAVKAYRKQPITFLVNNDY